MVVQDLFFWERSPPLEWQAGLRRLAPPRERAPHLVMTWLSGDHRTPVQRWLIWQAEPIAVASDVHREQFRDWVLERRGFDEETRWRTRYFLETGCITSPLWLCQGWDEGHPFSYNRIDEIAARNNGLPTRAPRPGEGPYRPFYPELVLPAIWERSLFHRRITSQAGELERREAEAARAVRKGIVEDENATLPEAVSAAYTDIVDERRLVSSTRQVLPDGSPDEDDARYIETGHFA